MIGSKIIGLCKSPKSPQDVPPPPPPGISLQEAEELRATVDELEVELTEARAQLAAQEEAGRRLSEGHNGQVKLCSFPAGICSSIVYVALQL